MKSWKARLMILVTVMAMLSSVAGPAMADDRDDCRRFHGERYCEVDRGNRFDKYYDNYYDNAFVFYPYPYFYPYSYYNNDCGYDWGGPLNPYDCLD